MTRPKFLLFGDTDGTRDAMRVSLENEGLGQILAQHFDVLVIELGSVENTTLLVTAMRSLHLECLIVGVSESLNVQEAELAIRLWAHVILKPSNISQVAELQDTKTHGISCPSFFNTDRWAAEAS